MSVHSTFGDSEPGGDLCGLHPVLPPHQGDLFLSWRHVLDDLPRVLQRYRVKCPGRGIRCGALIPGHDVGLLAAEGLPAPQVADVLVSQRAEQPGSLLASSTSAQPRPRPCRRLEGVLDQICGELAIATSAQERMAEQPPVMSCEERAQLGDMTWREPHLAATVHAAPPAASARAGSGWSAVSSSCLCSRAGAAKPLVPRGDVRHRPRRAHSAGRYRRNSDTPAMSSTHSAYTGDVCRARVDRCAGRMMCEFADSALVRA